MFIFQGIFLFQILLNLVSLMNTHKKLLKLSKAGAGTGKVM